MTECWHGTVGGYTNHACRCDLCRAAIAAKQRAWREANKDKVAAKKRAWREANKDKVAATQRAWRERLRAGEVQLPPLDGAVCERGGSDAQAMAHRRRGERPCPACLKAAARAARDRREKGARHDNGSPS